MFLSKCNFSVAFRDPTEHVCKGNYGLTYEVSGFGLYALYGHVKCFSVCIDDAVDYSIHITSVLLLQVALDCWPHGHLLRIALVVFFLP